MPAGDTAEGSDGLLRTHLRDAFFAHWPVAPETVAGRVPSGVDVATFDGRAWVGVVALVVENIRPPGAPFGITFPQLNFRTYVERPGDDHHSVYFLSLDGDDRVGVSVARHLFSLPFYSADVRVRRSTDGDVTFASHRTHRGAPPAHFDVTYRPVGEEFTCEPGTLDRFLLENYRFYTQGRALYYGDIAHPPWPLYEAEADLRTNTLFEACEFEAPTADPVFHYSPGTDVTAGRIHRARD